MKKPQLASAKKKIMKYAPIVTTATGIIATVTAAVVIARAKQNEDMLLFTEEDQEMVKTEDVNMRYSVRGSDYSLRYIGNTPSK